MAPAGGPSDDGQVFILWADESRDLAEYPKGSKEWKRILKNRYLGKKEKEPRAQGSLGAVYGITIHVDTAPYPPYLKFPTLTQKFHKRKKQKRARTGRR